MNNSTLKIGLPKALIFLVSVNLFTYSSFADEKKFSIYTGNDSGIYSEIDVREPAGDLSDEQVVAFSLEKTELINKLVASTTAASAWSTLVAFFSTLPSERAQTLWAESWENISIYFISQNTAQLTQALTQYLDSHDNIDFRSIFSMGRNGRINQAGTLRLYAMDILGVINPKASVNNALSVLKKEQNLAEQAIAIRNLVWADYLQHQKIIRDRAYKILTDPKVQSSPSNEALNFLDVFVYLKDFEALPLLVSFQRRDADSSLRSGSHLALYKLAQKNPLAVMNFLKGDYSRMSEYPLARADLFAMADISDLEQYNIIESYLLNQSISKEERSHFIGVFPNRNGFVSFNLLTEYDSDFDSPSKRRELGILPPEEEKIQDKAYLEIVTKLVGDPRFLEFKADFQALKEKLESFI